MQFKSLQLSCNKNGFCLNSLREMLILLYNHFEGCSLCCCWNVLFLLFCPLYLNISKARMNCRNTSLCNTIQFNSSTHGCLQKLNIIAFMNRGLDSIRFSKVYLINCQVSVRWNCHSLDCQAELRQWHEHLKLCYFCGQLNKWQQSGQLSVRSFFRVELLVVPFNRVLIWDAL